MWFNAKHTAKYGSIPKHFTESILIDQSWLISRLINTKVDSSMKRLISTEIISLSFERDMVSVTNYHLSRELGQLIIGLGMGAVGRMKLAVDVEQLLLPFLYDSSQRKWKQQLPPTFTIVDRPHEIIYCIWTHQTISLKRSLSRELVRGDMKQLSK